MEVLKMLRPDKIESLSTKFFYNGSGLCFQIMLSYGNKVYYRTFDQYDEYRTNHEQIVTAINNHQSIPNNFMSASYSGL